jgi:hypothetical protein
MTGMGGKRTLGSRRVARYLGGAGGHHMKALIVSAALLLAAPVAAQPTTAAREQASRPVVVESYYRVKWGSEDEFKELYNRNEAALLFEMKNKGFVTNLRFDEPFTHIPGEARWTLRATITYRDAPAAVEIGGSWDQAWEEARKRLLPDKKIFDTEQARRFALLEDHWDVIVTPFEPGK